MQAAAVALFRAQFGQDPAWIARAPGRVNLIGEHTDYNDGFVFPAAIDRFTWIAASPTDGLSQLLSANLGLAAPLDVTDSTPGAVTDWGQYAAGMAWAFREAGYSVGNLRAAVVSNVPMGSGVSSSAALEMALGAYWQGATPLDVDLVSLAKIGQRCENGYIGLRTGIMDQLASANGQAGAAMFIDTRSLEIAYAPVPEGLSMVILDTLKPRALTASAYNERRSQCEAAAALLGVASLRDATLTGLEAAADQLDPTAFRRARHVITENQRCLDFRLALENSDLDQIGALMAGSHDSLRDDYEVSCFELDAMVEGALASPGVVGVRMTGAGFGGCCIALVDSSQVNAFNQHCLATYERKTGLAGMAETCVAADGASAESLAS